MKQRCEILKSLHRQNGRLVSFAPWRKIVKNCEMERKTGRPCHQRDCSGFIQTRRIGTNSKTKKREAYCFAQFLSFIFSYKERSYGTTSRQDWQRKNWATVFVRVWKEYFSESGKIGSGFSCFLGQTNAKLETVKSNALVFVGQYYVFVVVVLLWWCCYGVVVLLLRCGDYCGVIVVVLLWRGGVVVWLWCCGVVVL